MLYRDSEHWRSAAQKRVMVFGMSGLGKTHMSTTLRASGHWFHYSIDYRIGTRYMGELIVDNAKAETWAPIDDESLGHQIPIFGIDIYEKK